MDNTDTRTMEEKFPYIKFYITPSDCGDIYMWVKREGKLEESLGRLMDKDQLPILNMVAREAIENNKRVCSTCFGLVDEKDVNNHFAGFYCPECWEQYKKTEGGECYICHQPRWKCTC